MYEASHYLDEMLNINTVACHWGARNSGPGKQDKWGGYGVEYGEARKSSFLRSPVVIIELMNPQR